MWDANQKLLYIKQNANRVALHKRLTKLKATNVYQKAFKDKQINMKNNVQDLITNERVKKSLHNNAFK